MRTNDDTPVRLLLKCCLMLLFNKGGKEQACEKLVAALLNLWYSVRDVIPCELGAN